MKLFISIPGCTGVSLQLFNYYKPEPRGPCALFIFIEPNGPRADGLVADNSFILAFVLRHRCWATRCCWLCRNFPTCTMLILDDFLRVPPGAFAAGALGRWFVSRRAILLRRRLLPRELPPPRPPPCCR